MIKEIRDKFNSEFSQEKYHEYIQQLEGDFKGEVDFRVAETPVFVPKNFTKKMISACESIVDVITGVNFKQITKKAIPEHLLVPGDEKRCEFIAFDFGICKNPSTGELEPQLIEMQGFPSLFCYEARQGEVAASLFNIPGNYSNYLSGLNKESYLQLLTSIVVGQYDPKHVVLLEIFPKSQKTRIDFWYTGKYLGIETVCLTDIIREGRSLFYKRGTEKVKIERIYNRLIFDELQQQNPSVIDKGKLFFEDLDVEWIPHPNWFFRISKYTLPFLHHPNIPETHFLKDMLHQLPHNLEDYVLKPLFSFAGQGVLIDVTKEDIDKITDPENWILQHKVQYADVIETPDGPAKAEIRIFYFWKEGDKRPIPTNNLARLSKGKMVGVRYNKDKTWVGGSIAFFEQ